MSNKLLNNIKILKEKRKTEKLNEWLNKTIDDNITNKDIFYEFYYEIETMLANKNHNINNKKQFKNELASYIYLESI
tara:strand:- start:3712 stop:3942 length:231 start_codon:yes stop_codon:yes gene_type:complete